MAATFVAAAHVAWPWLGGGLLAALQPPEDAFRTRLEAGDPGFVAPGGFVLLDVVAAEIGALYVHPDAEGTGLGRALLERGLGELAARGHADAALWTEERNAGPLRFYAHLGWHPDGGVRERTWHGARLRELRLVRPTATGRPADGSASGGAVGLPT
jgi:GNAT superfamily N-acetyltransferase